MPLKELRNGKLPKKLTVFRSLNNNITAAIDYRLQLLASLNGYPTPAHVIARVFTYLKLDSTSDLKAGILKLRDITQFASSILATIPQLRVGRHLLDRTQIQNYIVQNKLGYGHENLNDADIELVTFLITSSELMEASWALSMPIQPSSNNVVKFVSLYNSLKPSNDYRVKFDDTNKSITINTTSSLVHYLASNDSLIPLHETPLVQETLKRSFGSGNAVQQFETTEEFLRREDILIRLSDLRLIDHVLQLFLDIDIWGKFIPNRTKDDPSANEERVKGLKLLSAYLHSLLIMPHFLRVELFRQSYGKMEAWMGNFPNIPADIEKNYTDTVHKFDVFDVAKDAAELFTLSGEGHDKVLDSEIHIFFSEFTTAFGIQDVIASAEAVAGKGTMIHITDLAQLRDKKYNHLLLSHPIGKYEMTHDIVQRVLDAEIFKHNMNQAFSAVIPLVSKYLQEVILEEMKGMNIRPSIPLHPTIPATYDHTSMSDARVSESKFSHRYHSLPFTYDIEFDLRNAKLLSLFNFRSYSIAKPVTIAKDLDMAKKFRAIIGRDWMSAFPTSITYASRVIDVATLKNSEIELRQLLEEISGEHFELIRRSLQTPYTLEMWATILSSFALLFVTDKSMKGKLEGILPVTGLGMPYGKSYEALAASQEFTEADIITVIPGVYMAVLKHIPAPSHTLSVGTFALGRPYYYYAGNGETLPVTRLCLAPALMHMHLRPVSPMTDVPQILFDKIYAYLNDTLVMQSDSGLRLDPNSEQAYSESLPLSEVEWKNDRFSPLIHFVKLNAYTSTSVQVHKTESDVNKQIEEMERGLKEAEAGNPVTKENESKTDIEVS